MEKEIFSIVRRIENVRLKATEIENFVRDKTIPMLQEGLSCLKEAHHHFIMAQIAEKK